MSRFEPLYLAGPTGSGKTAVALELAKRVQPSAIVNADAYQIYAGLEILSAAPTEDEKAQSPHLLFGTHDIAEECDAARFSKLAKETIERLVPDIFPIVVGGSGLYLKAITHGLAPTPPGDSQLRSKLEPLSLKDLVEWYRKLDPIGAENTNLQNRRYVTRNLEICLLTGQAASDLKSDWENNAPDIKAIYLHREREDLYERINQRTPLMFAAGVVAEVEALGEISSTAEKAIGLREIRQYIADELDEATSIELIQQKTRRYAKRQESWFKRESSFHKIPVGRDDTAAEIANRIAEIHDLPLSVS